MVKIGAKIVRHGRSIVFQMAEVMVSRRVASALVVEIPDDRGWGWHRRSA